jgi:hypothetical protein
MSGVLAVFAVYSVGAADSTSGYEASVQQRYASERPLKSIGLAPFICPAELRCGELEDELIEHLERQTKLRVVGSKEVLQLMSKVGITDLANHEARMIISEALGVDAFALVAIPEARLEVVSPIENDKWKELKRQASLAQAGMELSIVARDGALLAQASGKARVYEPPRNLATVAARLFALMLERSWG